MTSATFDRHDQYDKVAGGLLPGEEIVAGYDALGVGTGFVALTTRWLVVQDDSFVGRRTSVTSVPYSRVTGVSFVSDTSVLGRMASTSTIAVSAGSRLYEVKLRGAEKARALHDGILSRIVT